MSEMEKGPSSDTGSSTAGDSEPLAENSEQPSTIENPLEGLIAAMREEQKQEVKAYEEYVRTSGYQDDLSAAHEAYSSVEKFEPGQLVQWKNFLRNSKYPQVGGPAIVVGYLDEPQSIGRDGEPLAEKKDICLGFLDGFQEFVVDTYSSRRFMPWN